MRRRRTKAKAKAEAKANRKKEGYKPLEHRGDLRRESPEEITAAYPSAIKRDIENHESDKILMQWKHDVLNTTCKFVPLPTARSRYWSTMGSWTNGGATCSVLPAKSYG